jgi:hypothetical protein
MVRRLALILAVAGLVIGGLIVKSMTDAGRAEAEMQQRLDDRYLEDVSVRTEMGGGRYPQPQEIVTIDGVDRDDCIVEGPDDDPELSCVGSPRPTPED